MNILYWVEGVGDVNFDRIFCGMGWDLTTTHDDGVGPLSHSENIRDCWLESDGPRTLMKHNHGFPCMVTTSIDNAVAKLWKGNYYENPYSRHKIIF